MGRLKVVSKGLNFVIYLLFIFVGPVQVQGSTEITFSDPTKQVFVLKDEEGIQDRDLYYEYKQNPWFACDQNHVYIKRGSSSEHIQRWEDCYSSRTEESVKSKRETTGVRTSYIYQIGYIDFTCECRVTSLNAGYYVKYGYVRGTCTQCPAGSETIGCGDTVQYNWRGERMYQSAGHCEECEVGSYRSDEEGMTCNKCLQGFVAPNTGSSSCTQCQEPGKVQYSNAMRNECKQCTQCSDNQVVLGCGESDLPGTCVCKKGYFKGFYDCEPVRVGWYKSEIGDSSDLIEQCPYTGTQKTTRKEAATGIEECVCPQNWYLKTDGWCQKCAENTPFRPLTASDDESKCRACELWEYWTGNECQDLKRLKIVIQENALFIESYDEFRRHGNDIQAQSRKQSVRGENYLHVEFNQPFQVFFSAQNNTVHLCANCSDPFSDRVGCGGQNVYPKWITFQDIYPNPVVRREWFLSNVAGSSDNDYKYLASKFHQNHEVIREGRCMKCKECEKGQYQSGCLEQTTCTQCLDIAQCDSNHYLAHATNAVPGDNDVWVGACDVNPNNARSDYFCAPCRKWQEEEGEYSLLIGCGNTLTFTRWSPESQYDVKLNVVMCNYQESNENCKLAPLTVHPTPSAYMAHTATIPYCAPGWWVNIEAEGCLLGTDFEGTHEWSSDCCQRCGDADEAKKIRSPDYVSCTGSSSSDTQVFIDRCENNYYEYVHENGDVSSCRQCTTCL